MSLWAMMIMREPNVVELAHLLLGCTLHPNMLQVYLKVRYKTLS